MARQPAKIINQKYLNRDCQRPEISLLTLKNVANFLKQLQEERCICVKLKSGLLVGLHVTVVYVIANNVREKKCYSQQTRSQRLKVTFDSEILTIHNPFSK